MWTRTSQVGKERRLAEFCARVLLRVNTSHSCLLFVHAWVAVCVCGCLSCARLLEAVTEADALDHCHDELHLYALSRGLERLLQRSCSIVSVHVDGIGSFGGDPFTVRTLMHHRILYRGFQSAPWLRSGAKHPALGQRGKGALWKWYACVCVHSGLSWCPAFSRCFLPFNTVCVIALPY